MCYNIEAMERRGLKYALHEHYLIDNFDYDANTVEHYAYHHVSGFAHPKLNIITQEKPHLFSLYSWGLIPNAFWVKDLAYAKQLSNQTLNCIGEEMWEKASFKKLPLSHRCIVPATGFYESHTCGKSKFPFYIYAKDRSLFSLGGLYDTWVDKSSGELFNTFTIITTQANELCAKIHNEKKRMPVIVPRDREKEWLSPELTKEDVMSFISPFPACEMSAHPVAKFVNSAKEHRNIPAATEKAHYPEIENLL